ncbi:MAG: ribosome maturation factor RimM [Microcoleaceae cyanobacterium]
MVEWIEIGRIVAPQGLRGEVRVQPSTDFPERFLEPGQRWLLTQDQMEPKPIELLQGRFVTGKGFFVIQYAGIEKRNQAEALRGSRLLVTDQDRPELEADEFYVIDLVGLEVFNQAAGTVIGKVVDIIPAGNDLLEVELYQEDQQPNSSQKKRKVLIPFVEEIVPVVEIAQGRLEINPPVGLVD